MMAPFMLFRYLTWLTIVACLFVNFVGFGYWNANWKSECAGGLELELAFEFHLGLNCFKINILGGFYLKFPLAHESVKIHQWNIDQY